MEKKIKWIVPTLTLLFLLAACGGQTDTAEKSSSQTANDAGAISENPTLPVEPTQVVNQTKNSSENAGTTLTATEANNETASEETETGSESQEAEIANAGNEIQRPEGWDEETHGKDVDPNYEIVFPDGEVNRIDITLEPDQWQAMLDDMTENYGEFGAGGERGGGMAPGGDNAGGNMTPPADGNAPPQGNGLPPADGNAPPQGNGLPPADGNAPQQGGGPGGGQPNMDQVFNMEVSEDNPVWAEATIQFNGETWTNVGIRFKGNSSLTSSWRQGVYKLPFKLDFDQFEDEYPGIEDQRFYGFKQLSLSNNTRDASFLRETLAADMFRQAGVPAPVTAFYAVYLDYGDGPVYFGLYTMVEVIDDTLIETQFADAGGNLYKPEGSGATFAADLFDKAAFDKETNIDEADYSDVQALYEVLNSDLRTTDPAAWRSELESIFNVEVFIHWLAANTVIQNWDAYGSAAHNFYLYNDPTTGQLTWIVWDMNESLRSNSGMRSTASLGQENVTDQWPLIRYLMDDEVYHAQYVTTITDFAANVMDPDTVTAKVRELAELVRPFAASEVEGYTFLTSSDEFDTGLDQLIQHIQARYQAALDYTAEQ